MPTSCRSAPTTRGNGVLVYGLVFAATGGVYQTGTLCVRSQLAAHRAGIKTVLFPQDNKVNLEEIPKKVQQQIKLIPVRSIDEVVDLSVMKKVKKAEPGVKQRRTLRQTRPYV